jgi:PIN domain nuclease of toxin-antitoxin system
MEKIVLDTHAALAFFFNEKGAGKAEDIISAAKRASTPILMSAVNYGELFYAVQKKAGRAAAIKARDMLDAIPVDIVDAGRDMALLAGSYKAENKMSFADCFCAALARIHNAAIVTGDREFAEVEGEIRVIWIL